MCVGAAKEIRGPSACGIRRPVTPCISATVDRDLTRLCRGLFTARHGSAEGKRDLVKNLLRPGAAISFRARRAPFLKASQAATTPAALRRAGRGLFDGEP